MRSQENVMRHQHCTFADRGHSNEPNQQRRNVNMDVLSRCRAVAPTQDEHLLDFGHPRASAGGQEAAAAALSYGQAIS